MDGRMDHDDGRWLRLRHPVRIPNKSNPIFYRTMEETHIEQEQLEPSEDEESTDTDHDDEEEESKDLVRSTAMSNSTPAATTTTTTAMMPPMSSNKSAIKGVMRIKLSLSRGSHSNRKLAASHANPAPSAMRGAALPLTRSNPNTGTAAQGDIQDENVGLFSEVPVTVPTSSDLKSVDLVPISGNNIPPNTSMWKMMSSNTAKVSSSTSPTMSSNISPVRAALMNYLSDTGISQLLPIKVPSSIVSPGLLFPPSAPLRTPSAVYRQAIAKAFGNVKNDKEALASPSALDASATEHKGMFRGSSVRREVGDMFDSRVLVTDAKEVKASLLSAIDFYDALIPKDLIEQKVHVTRRRKRKVSAISEDDGEGENVVKRSESSLLSLFMKTLGDTLQNTQSDNKSKMRLDQSSSCRLSPLLSFVDMVPKSLTTEYPPEFILKHQKYLKAVESREIVILEAQKAKDELDISLESYANALEQWNSKMLEHPNDPPPQPMKPHTPKMVPSIPPIPIPPSPPQLEALDEGKKSLTMHLDPNLFWLTCRYHDLTSNVFADPQFFGPCAPGIATLAAGSGSNNLTNIPPITGGLSMPKERKDALHKSTSGTTSNEGKALKIKSGKKKTASALKSQELRTIFENNDEDVPKLRDSMIRAAITCFTDGNGDGRTPWIASNGETYPDIGKSFSAFSNVKPCTRCRSNKQGAYHCRLRRKHKEPDWDGLGYSTLLLGPYMDEYKKAPLLATVPDATEEMPEAIAEALDTDLNNEE